MASIADQVDQIKKAVLGSNDTTNNDFPLNPADLKDLGDLQALADTLSLAGDLTKTKDDLGLVDLISNGPTTAAADPTLADIMASLSAATGGPSTEVEQGKIPMPQNVGIVPPYNDTNVGLNYNYLVEMSSITSLYMAIMNATLRQKRGHPDAYDITVPTEAAQGFADMANSAYQVMVGPLAGFYNFGSGTVTTYSQEMEKTTVHLEFLKEIFKGFSLTKGALMQLDGVLSSFIDSLGTVTVETNSAVNTVDQTIRINQVVRTNISGDESNPIWVFQPRTRIVYMHVDAGTWHWATNKADHTSSKFNMRYVVVDCDLNVNKYLASKDKLDAVFTQVSGKSMAEFGKMTNPVPVANDN